MFNRVSVFAVFTLPLCGALGFACSTGGEGEEGRRTRQQSTGGTSAVAGSAQTSGSGGTTVIDVGGNTANGGQSSTARGPLESCPGCVWNTCKDGSKTTLSGVVHTPARNNPDPIYNAVVYVPATQPAPFADQVTCERCGQVSGKPVAAALTGPDGKFAMQDVPSGKDVPVVIQLGKWRRQVRIPEVKACQDNAVPEELTRFARNKSEGDIPRIAIVTSPYDPLECILRSIGIDEAEFTVPSADGRVHVYAGGGSDLGPATPYPRELWTDVETLKNYDMVLLPCGSTPSRSVSADPEQALANVEQYTEAGGRVFITDLSFDLLTNSSKRRDVANWLPSLDDVGFGKIGGTVDTSFPKGVALATWLQIIGATTTLGELELLDTYQRAESVKAKTQRWLYTKAPETLQTFTFNTPLGVADEAQCGRVAYSSFHIASSSIASGSNAHFPNRCADTPLTAQERVLEFLLFDLASCVQIETDPPQVPTIVK
jgi:hypothetical protein